MSTHFRRGVCNPPGARSGGGPGGPANPPGGPPETPGAAELVARASAAVEASADGVNFYNYGLIPEPRLAWVRSAVDAISP